VLVFAKATPKPGGARAIDHRHSWPTQWFLILDWLQTVFCLSKNALQIQLLLAQ
jgi:5'(3')-deoxyribonucleotidase